MTRSARPLDIGELGELAGAADLKAPEHLFLRNQALAELERTSSRPRDDANGVFYGSFAHDGCELVGFFGVGRVLVFGPGTRAAGSMFRGPSLVEQKGYRIVIGPSEPVRGLLASIDEDARIDLERSQPFFCVASAPDLGEGCSMREPAAKDVDWLVEANLQLNEEDLGIPAATIDRGVLRARVISRMHEGRTRIVDRGGEPACKLEIGSDGPAGALVEGVYTAEAERGKGLARRLVAGVSRELLASRPVVGLHVGRENRGAIRAYVAAGMREVADLRIALVDW